MRKYRCRHGGRAAALAVFALTIAPGFVAGVAAQARPYQPSGPRITGGADSGAATALTPGVHVDTLDEGAADPSDTGSVRYYAIAVRTGESPYVAVTVAAPDEVSDDVSLGVTVSLTERGATSKCSNETATDFAADGHLDPVTAIAAPGPAGSKGGCAAGTLIVRVERTGDAVADDPIDVEPAYR